MPLTGGPEYGVPATAARSTAFLSLDLQSGLLPVLMGLLALPMLSTALAIRLLLLAIPVWRMHNLSRPGLIVYSVVTMFALGFVFLS
jgi:hypothetical protein